MRRSANGFLALVAFPLLPGCVGSDFGCCGSLDRLAPTFAVVDGQVVGGDHVEFVLLEVDRVRAPIPPQRLTPGDRIEVDIAFPEYQLEESELTFFLTPSGVSGRDWTINYAHDRSTDTPVTGFPNRQSPYGTTVEEMLDCLVTEHDTNDESQPRLTALVAETMAVPKLEAICARSQDS
jgi:hypothetical protein